MYHSLAHLPIFRLELAINFERRSLLESPCNSFHAVYWPALLMALSLPPPSSVLVHSHWTMSDLKMSKSRGNVVDPFKAIEEVGVDGVRFYLMSVGGELKQDSGPLTPDAASLRCGE